MEDIEDDDSDQIANIVSSISPLPTSNAVTTTASAATDSPVAIVQGVKLVINNSVFLREIYLFLFSVECLICL